MFCGPETVDVSRGEAEGNIDGRGSTKHTAFLVLSPVHVLQMSPVQVLQVQSSPGFTTCRQDDFFRTGNQPISVRHLSQSYNKYSS